MTFRRIVTLGLFGCLAATAACALVAVFVFEAWAWHLTSTSLILSITASIWAIALRRQSARITPLVYGILGGTGIAACFFCAALWAPSMARTVEEQVVTGVIALGMVVLAGPLLTALDSQRLRSAAIAALCVQAVAAALWLAEVWGLLWADDGRCGWVLVGASYVLGANLIGPGAEATAAQVLNSRLWRGTGALITLLAAVLSCAYLEVWPIVQTGRPYDGPGLPRLLTWVVAACTVAVTLAMANILRYAKGPPWVRWVHRGALAGVLMQGALLMTLIELDAFFDTTGRIVVSLTVLVVSALTASLVMDRIARIKVARSAVDLVEIRLECPVCSTKQTVAFGDSTCRSCGLGFHITVKQNKCFQCGYALAGLAGASSCPECGCALTDAAVAPAA